MSTLILGKTGEDLAAGYLARLGYIIIERNFRIRGGEIDLVAIDGDTTVYVEVKSRTSNRFGLPQEAITKSKLHFIERSAKFYRHVRKNLNLPQLERIDIVAINFEDPKNPKIELIKNAQL